MTFGIIRDADISVQSSFNSIVEKFDETSLDFPKKPNIFTNSIPKVGIFIIGNDRDIKMLEDLCLKTIESRAEMKCVNKFCKCVSDLEGEKPKNQSKARAQAYLATKPNYAAHIGLGAKEGYWDFKSEVLNELRNFIMKKKI